MTLFPEIHRIGEDGDGKDDDDKVPFYASVWFIALVTGAAMVIAFVILAISFRRTAIKYSRQSTPSPGHHMKSMDSLPYHIGSEYNIQVPFQ